MGDGTENSEGQRGEGEGTRLEKYLFVSRLMLNTDLQRSRMSQTTHR